MDARSPQPARFDPRIVGAVLALGLDLVCIVLGALLANSTQPQDLAGFLLLAGAPGVIVGPLVGWRFGRVAAARQPLGSWAPRAVATAFAVGLGLWFAYDVGALLLLGSPGGLGNLPSFLVLAVFETTVFALGATLTVVLPLGAIWVGLMRTLGPRLDPLGTSA